MADNLSGLDMRVMLCVASHDRLSLVKGKGQGCRASNERMSQMVGCSYARLCTTLTNLTASGYLRQEKLGRNTVYRVIYTDDDRLLFGKVSGRSKGCLPAAETGVTDYQHSQRTGANLPETASQYIPLNGGRYSVETGEENSVETAHLAPRWLGKRANCINVGGQLARLERALTVGQEIDDPVDWYRWLETVCETDNPANRGRAFRLGEWLLETMCPDEFNRALARA